MLLQLTGICKNYITDEVETRALLDVTLGIERGEYVSIEGPSGCGKSTLLSIIGLLDTPSNGSYVLNGRNVEALSSGERAAIRNREIGFIFQNFNLIGDLTVEENIELQLAYRGEQKPNAGVASRKSWNGSTSRIARATIRRSSPEVNNNAS